jgi:thioredoxin reductase (NADPH)
MDETDAERHVAFPRLDDADIAALTTIGTRRRLRDGELLFEAGGRGGFFVVLAGAVEIVDRSGDEPRTVTVHRPGEFTGDIDILSRRRPVVSAVARGDTEVLYIPSTDIRRIITERPALGETVLRAFITRRASLVESGFQGLRVIGSERSRQAFLIREFLARNQVPFTWIGVEAEPAVGELLGRLGLTPNDLPVAAFGTRSLLRNPSIRVLAEALGLKRPLDGRAYDLVVVGAGPAGLAAAVYSASEGLSTLVLDGVAPGGQAGASTKIENYLGFPTGISGADLMGRAVLQAQKFGAEFSTPCPATELDVGGPRPVVRIEGGERVEARCVLIATGADYRKLDVPNRERFDGLGVYYAATQTELVSCRGSEVVVVGGGNSAGQAIVFLAAHTRRVLVLLRGGDMGKSMSSYLVSRIQALGNVEVLYHTEIQQTFGDATLEAVEIENTRTGERRRVATPAVFSFIGAVPRTRWLPPQIETDTKGFIRTGRGVAASSHWALERGPFLLETSCPGVFAAGDVRLGSIKRVSSAVGEGAMAIKYIHEYLAEQQPVS